MTTTQLAPLRPSLTITSTDLAELRPWAERSPDDNLDAELRRARIVPASEVPPNVVTMNSRLAFIDTETGARRSITLVFPNEADAADGRISVLAPIGSAVLGLRVGDEIDWPLPKGRQARLRIVEVSWQPQAAGV